MRLTCSYLSVWLWSCKSSICTAMVQSMQWCTVAVTKLLFHSLLCGLHSVHIPFCLNFKPYRIPCVLLVLYRSVPCSHTRTHRLTYHMYHASVKNVVVLVLLPGLAMHLELLLHTTIVLHVQIRNDNFIDHNSKWSISAFLEKLDMVNPGLYLQATWARDFKFGGAA